MQKLSEIQAAEQEAAVLVQQARQQAAELVAAAKAKANVILAEGSEETRRLTRTHGTKYVLQAQQEAQSMVDASKARAQLDVQPERRKQSVTSAIAHIVG